MNGYNKCYPQVDKSHRNFENSSILTKNKRKNSLDLKFFHKIFNGKNIILVMKYFF